MSLTQETIRKRKFTMGMWATAQRYFNGKFTLFLRELRNINELIPRLVKQTFSVKVVNQPNTVNYKTDFKTLSQGIDKLSKSLKSIESKEEKEIDFSELMKELAKVSKGINAIKFPKFPELPDGKENTKEIIKSLKLLQNQIKRIPQPVIPQPKEIVFPQQMSMVESQEIIQAIRQLELRLTGFNIEIPETQQVDNSDVLESLDKLRKAIDNIPPAPEFPASIEIGNFPPQKIPQPVTNININPLRGLVHSTTTAVSTTLTTLPGYGVLDGRRSVIFYNNDSTTTVFIGGSDVTVANGLPLEPKAFSPSFDSGPLQRWYGITSSGSVDVRTIEIANDSGQ